MIRTRLIAFAMVVGVALAACGSATSGSGQQAPASLQVPASAVPTTLPFPSVVMPKELLGVWIANVQKPGPSNGIWRLRITEHLMELKNPAAASDADYFWLWTDRIDGTSFHMAADSDCKGATYTWAIQGGQLLMTTADDARTSDPCGDRTVTLTTPFKRDS